MNGGHTIYFAGLIGSVAPNALRIRIMQNALEDTCAFDFAMHVMHNTRPNRRTSLMELLPYLVAYGNMKKTHIGPWLARVAAQRLLDGKLPYCPAVVPTLEMPEDVFAATVASILVDKKYELLEKAHPEAAKMSRYLNHSNLLPAPRTHRASPRRQLTRESAR